MQEVDCMLKENHTTHKKELLNLKESINTRRIELNNLVIENYKDHQGLIVSEEIQHLSKELDELIGTYLRLQEEQTNQKE